MSDLSVLMHKFGNFFQGVVSTAPPAARTQLTDVADAFTQAAALAEQAVPTIAKSVVDALEATYGASGYIPLTNAIFDAIAAELAARKAATATAPDPGASALIHGG